MSTYGKTLPKYYDAIMYNSKSIDSLVRPFINKYAPRPQKVLEVACGTGNILCAFPKTIELHGLDLSKEMLAIAKKKVPYAKFHYGNMADFSLPDRFDLIFCVFDAINHLNRFSEWKKMFATISKHLTKEGIFIFDMNSLPRLKVLSEKLPIVEHVKDATIIRQIKPTSKKDTYNIQFTIFEKERNNLYKKTIEDIIESAYATEVIKKALEKHFIVKEVYKKQMEDYNSLSTRDVFVCKKK